MAQDRGASGWTSPLDWLLLAIPAAFALRYVPGWQHETLLFAVAGIGIIPLAAWMGRATDQLGARSGAGVGGLLNATFGNAAELIIAVVALRQGLVSLVKASLTGSIIGNLLFVLGISVISGGVRFRHQTFNGTAARMASTSLALAAVGLIIPSVFHTSAERLGGWTREAQQDLSLAIASVLFITYGLSLVFILVTHKDLYRGKAEGPADLEAVWPVSWAVLVLGVAAVLTTFLSEFLVHSVESAKKTLGVTERFVGIVIVAIIGNAAEHSTAVWMALRNKMDLSLSIAIGSSVQVALFVTPVLVFVSYLFGEPMTLEFTLPEVAGVALAVWIVAVISGDGESNWMEGVQLVSVYLILAILFFFLPEKERAHTSAPGSITPAAESRSVEK